MSATKLNSNKVFVAFMSDRQYKLVGVVYTISGATVSKGTTTELTSDSIASEHISVVALSEEQVFITFARFSSYHRLMGRACTISGTTITAGALTELSSIFYSGEINTVVKLSNNRVFITGTGRNNKCRPLSIWKNL